MQICIVFSISYYNKQKKFLQCARQQVRVIFCEFIPNTGPFKRERGEGGLFVRICLLAT